MATLHQFTMELDLHRSTLECKNCATHNDFISHGFVIKKCSQNDPQKVGKRLLCANRYGRSGCGATLRLYLTASIPGFKHSAFVMTLFLTGLLRGLSIQEAYQSATHTDDPRHAYRWIRRCYDKLIVYRGRLKGHSGSLSGQFSSRVHSLRLLLPTLAQLFREMEQPSCQHYQALWQQAFV